MTQEADTDRPDGMDPKAYQQRRSHCYRNSESGNALQEAYEYPADDQDLQKLEKPLQTVNELSETVDLVHEASRNAVRSALVTIIENASSIKDWIFSKKKEESQTEGIVAEEDVHEQK